MDREELNNKKKSLGFWGFLTLLPKLAEFTGLRFYTQLFP